MKILRPAAQALQQLCGSDLEDLAPETRVIQRRRKFDAIFLLRTLVFTVLKHPVPTPADYQRTACQCGVDVSRAAKHGRAASSEYPRWQDWTIFVTDCARAADVAGGRGAV